MIVLASKPPEHHTVSRLAQLVKSCFTSVAPARFSNPVTSVILVKPRNQ